MATSSSRSYGVYLDYCSDEFSHVLDRFVVREQHSLGAGYQSTQGHPYKLVA